MHFFDGFRKPHFPWRAVACPSCAPPPPRDVGPQLKSADAGALTGGDVLGLGDAKTKAPPFSRASGGPSSANVRRAHVARRPIRPSPIRVIRVSSPGRQHRHRGSRIPWAPIHGPDRAAGRVPSPPPGRAVTSPWRQWPPMRRPTGYTLCFRPTPQHHDQSVSVFPPHAVRSAHRPGSGSVRSGRCPLFRRSLQDAGPHAWRNSSCLCPKANPDTVQLSGWAPATNTGLIFLSLIHPSAPGPSLGWVLCRSRATVPPPPTVGVG